MVTLTTTLGNIELELLHEEAPKTVANFLDYIHAGQYNGTIFHRVIDNFMIQGGGFDTDFNQKATNEPIENEAVNRVGNKRGTVAMARTSDPDSATCQFFINVKDNNFLDFKSPTPQGFGYCVFARVVNGMDVVDEIKEVETGTHNGHSDVPLENIVIEEIVCH